MGAGTDPEKGCAESSRPRGFFAIPSDLASSRSVIALHRVLTAAVIFLFLKHSLLGVWSYLGLDFSLFYEAADAIRHGRSPYAGILGQPCDLPLRP